MWTLYVILTAVHIVSMVVTGILWTLYDLGYRDALRPHLRDIRAVHFGSLYLVPWFLGLGLAFDKLGVPAWHQIFFPAGLGALVFVTVITCLLFATIAAGKPPMALVVDSKLSGPAQKALADLEQVLESRFALTRAQAVPANSPSIVVGIAGTSQSVDALLLAQR